MRKERKNEKRKKEDWRNCVGDLNASKKRETTKNIQNKIMICKYSSKYMLNKQLYHCRKWQGSKSVYVYCVVIFKMLIYFFLLMHYIATFDGGCLQNCHYREMAWLPFQKRDQGKYLVLIITWTLKKLFVMFLC